MASSSHLDAALSNNIRKYIDDFFGSLHRDDHSIKSFLSKFSTFNHTIQTHHHQLRRETLVEARNFANVVDTVALGILDLENTEQRLHNETLTDLSRTLDKDMSRLSLNDDNTRKHPDGPPKYPAYIKPSYQWLLSNLHNPYPSKDFKRELSRRTECPLKDIDAWFTDTRKRIGWNKLRKTKFSNKQDRIITAATHVFKSGASSFSDNPDCTLLSDMHPLDAYRVDFLAIAATAKSLYADKFPDMAMASMNSLQTLSRNTLREIPSNALVFDTYPTPEPSPSRVDDELPPNHTSTSRKRRRSSLDVVEGELEIACSGASKKSRFMHTIDMNTAMSSLPSPATSTTYLSDDAEEREPSGSSNNGEDLLLPQISGLKRKRGPIDEDHQHPSNAASKHPQVTPSVISATPTRKRKRRLSDGDSQIVPKRPHNSLCVPRIQMVSDPLPMTRPSLEDSYESWLSNSLVSEHDLSDSIPLPTNMEDPFSSTAPLQVHHGQYDVAAFLPDINTTEEDFAGFIAGELDASFYSSQNSQKYGLYVVEPCYQDSFYNSPFDINVGTADLFDFEHVISTPECTLSSSSELFGLDFKHSSSKSEWEPCIPSYQETITPTGDTTAKSRCAAPRSFSSEDVLDAKRAKLQALMEEVRQLEAEL